MSPSFQEQAQAEMWERIAEGRDESPPSDRPPSTKQVYALARALLERLDLEWPATRRAASRLIAQVRSDAGIGE